jgi:hypothetical protein
LECGLDVGADFGHRVFCNTLKNKTPASKEIIRCGASGEAAWSFAWAK